MLAILKFTFTIQVDDSEDGLSNTVMREEKKTRYQILCRQNLFRIKGKERETERAAHCTAKMVLINGLNQ